MCTSTVLLTSGHFRGIRAQEPELTTDFFVPIGSNASDLDGSYFTFQGFRFPGLSGGHENGTPFNATIVTTTDFPCLTGLAVSMAILSFEADALDPPHSHPRGTELMYVLQGSLDIGFVDTTNKLYSQTLIAGDVFVFPEGLLHYQINPSEVDPSLAIVFFSSSNPGTVNLTSALFDTGISELLLEQAFNTSSVVIEEIQSEFGTGKETNVSQSPMWAPMAAPAKTH